MPRHAEAALWEKAASLAAETHAAEISLPRQWVRCEEQPPRARVAMERKAARAIVSVVISEGVENQPTQSL